MPRELTFVDRKLAAVVLAAGGSARLGRPKQLLRHRGTPLIVKSARLALGVAGAGVTVVLGSEHMRLRSLLRRDLTGVTAVRNPQWHEGLATSLAAGLDGVSQTAAATLIMLVDQAMLDAADLARLAVCWRRRPGRPAAARYHGHAGVPAIIPRRWFKELSALEGDIGARRLLRQIGDLSLVDMPSAAFDVDTPADAAALGF